MFNMNSIMQMMGNSPELQQLMTLKNMLDKLPKEKQTELVGNFVNSLQEAVKEQESK